MGRCDGCWAGNLENECSSAPASLFGLPSTQDEGWGRGMEGAGSAGRLEGEDSSALTRLIDPLATPEEGEAGKWGWSKHRGGLVLVACPFAAPPWTRGGQGWGGGGGGGRGNPTAR